jgi:hypothetical protein
VVRSSRRVLLVGGEASRDVEMITPNSLRPPIARRRRRPGAKNRGEGRDRLTSSHDEVVYVGCVSGLEMEERVFLT